VRHAGGPASQGDEIHVGERCLLPSQGWALEECVNMNSYGLPKSHFLMWMSGDCQS
jgi:hypothetical protein